MTIGAMVEDSGPDLEIGQPEPEASPELVASEPQAPEDLLDPNLYGDYRVPVKVNGQDQYVPLRDITSGFMMQSDYTQKTQVLAAERARLEQADNLMRAMEADPAGTLQALQDAYQQQFGDDADDDFELSDEERQIRELTAWKQQQESRELDAWIDSQIAGLKSQHGDFNEAELFDFMLQEGIKNFQTAYAAFAFQRQLAQQQSDRLAGDAKRQLPPVAGGRSVAAGSVAAGSGAPAGSLREAALDAFRTHGIV